MTLTELRYIVTLAEECHFGRAAERCYVSQPTLSVAVKKLEDELGVTLFERHKGNIRVSEVGDNLVQQAQKILHQVHIFKEMAEAGKEQLEAPLKLGAIYTIGPYLLPALIPQLADLAPKMPLYIEENYTANLKEKLRRCELDAIVIALPFEEPDILTSLLYDEEFVVAVPKGHALEQETQIEGAMLAQEHLLMLGPGHCFREQVLDACSELQAIVGRQSAASKRKDDTARHVITEGSSLETIRYMVASRLGISVLPRSAVQTDQEHLLSIRPFAAPRPHRTVALAWRASFPRPKAIELLGMCIRQLNMAATTPVRQ